MKPQNGALWSYGAVYTFDRNMRSASKILYQRVLQKKLCKDKKNAFLVLRFTMVYFLFHSRHHLIRFLLYLRDKCNSVAQLGLIAFHSITHLHPILL